MIDKIARRFYHDFMLPDQSKKYEGMLRELKNEGYHFHSVSSFETVIREGIDRDTKYCILRRDIDTCNKKILREMLDIEKNFGARCTYYFRLRTMDVPFMRLVEKCGGEASYHYEEIASYSLMHHIKEPEEVYRHMGKIQEQFRKNLREVREVTGLPCITVASHGEWINERLGIMNRELLNDESLRESCGIIREAYDDDAMKYVEIRIADHNTLDYIGMVKKAIKKRSKVIYLLTHPAQWRADLAGSVRHDARRMMDAAFW